MTIQIRDEVNGKIITFDNNSMMAGKGKIGYGQITKNCCFDGDMTKAQAKEEIEAWVKEFLK